MNHESWSGSACTSLVDSTNNLTIRFTMKADWVFWLRKTLSRLFKIILMLLISRKLQKSFSAECREFGRERGPFLENGSKSKVMIHNSAIKKLFFYYFQVNFLNLMKWRTHTAPLWFLRPREVIRGHHHLKLYTIMKTTCWWSEWCQNWLNHYLMINEKHWQGRKKNIPA